MLIRTLHLVEAIPASGKTMNEINYIAKSSHNRFLYACKGVNQIDELVNDLKKADSSIVISPFKAETMVFGSVVESIEKFIESISPTDTRKHVVVITHNAYDRFISTKFLNDANFHLSYDEKPDFVIDLDVAYDSHTKPEHIRIVKDGKVTLTHEARENMKTEEKFRLHKDSLIDFIKFVTSGRYDVFLVTDKNVKDQHHEYYQAYIKENYFLNTTRILSYGLIGSTFHTYISKEFTSTTITTETIEYTHRDHKIIVTPMTKKRNTNYIQTHYAAEYERMMHKMFDLAIAQNGKAMSYTNKIHDDIAKIYEKKNVATHLPNYLHGLNNFKDYDVLVTTFASNRTPESVMGLTEKLGIDRDTALLERSKDALIQVAQRGVTRDYDNTGRSMKIYVVSLEDAEHIKATIPNVEIDMTFILNNEFPFSKKINKPAALTPKERKLIMNIKKNGTLKAPNKVQYVLNQNKKLSGIKYKEALMKANIWDCFSSAGRWIKN